MDVDYYLSMIEKFINIFIVNGVDLDSQQNVKVTILISGVVLIILLGYLLVNVISKLVNPVMSNLRNNAEYIFYIVIAIISLIFIKEISFGGLCTFFFFFSLMTFTYKYMMREKPESANDSKKNHPRSRVKL